MKKILLFAIFFSIQNQILAQKSGWKPEVLNHQVGIFLGTSNYLGDLAFKAKIPIIGEMNPQAFSFTGGINYRYNFAYFFSLRAGISYARLFGDDSKTNGDIYRINRNLSFRTDILDLNAMIEWNMLKYEIGKTKKRFIAPYLGLGVAAFYFNPQAELNGVWHELQPLGTEGQGLIEGLEKYNQFQIAVPFALGLKYNITKQFAIGMEFQYRFTFTDYLDDVSSNFYVDQNLFYSNYSKDQADIVDQLAYRAIDPSITLRDLDVRGNPKNNDHYFLIFMSLSYKITDNSRFKPKVN